MELYNPADLYAAFAEAARDEAGLEPEPTAAEDLLEVAGVASEMGVEQDEDREPDEGWVDHISPPSDTAEAARMLYDLALTFQERSQRAEARLLDQFQESSEGLAAALGDRMVLDDEDERLWYRSSGAFEAEVVPETDEEGEPTWQALTSAEDMVQFYDPTDLFGDLAEAIADQYPGVAPELDDEDGPEDDEDDLGDEDERGRRRAALTGRAARHCHRLTDPRSCRNPRTMRTARRWDRAGSSGPHRARSGDGCRG